jgi:hypothetical protein
MAAGMVASLESVLDKRLEDLISKLVAGNASPEERAEIAALTKQRSMLMYPPRLERPSPSHWSRRPRSIVA